MVEKCPLVMNGWVTCVDLNVLPLGSYDVLIGMDWLEAHRVKLDSYHKTFECMEEEGNPRVVRGIPKVISVRQILAMQLKKLCRKGFQLYVAHIEGETMNKLLGWRNFMCCRNSRMFFLMKFQGFLQKGH